VHWCINNNYKPIIAQLVNSTFVTPNGMFHTQTTYIFLLMLGWIEEVLWKTYCDPYTLRRLWSTRWFRQILLHSAESVLEIKWYFRMACFHQMHFVTGATELYNIWVISNGDYRFAAEHMIRQRGIWETRHIYLLMLDKRENARIL
jgi:hypothetical protein